MEGTKNTRGGNGEGGGGGEEEEKKNRNEGAVKCGCTTSETVREKKQWLRFRAGACVRFSLCCVSRAQRDGREGMQNDFSAEIRAIRIGCNLNEWVEESTNVEKGKWEKRLLSLLALSLSLSFHPGPPISWKIFHFLRIFSACTRREDRWAVFKNYFRRKIYTELGLNVEMWLQVFVVNFCCTLFSS